MAIVGVRIDDRLIHGQVCGYWIPQYKVERILIVDNEVCNDEARKTALKFGLELVQKGYHLDEICIGNMSTRQGAKQIKKTVYVTEEDKKDFLELSKLGVKLYLQEKPTDGKEDLVNLL